MKKISYIICLFVAIFCLNINASAAEKTLNQLQSEAEANRAAYNKAKEQKTTTESEKAATTAQKQQIEGQISQIQKESETIENEIAKIKEDITVKEKEIKALMSFVQITNGETSYLEYAFGAKSFTDFIYRISVAEQLSDYNDKLVEEYTEKVEEMQNKKKELETKQKELAKKQEELAILEAKLSSEIQTLKEGMSSKDDEYKTTISLINNLKKLGCKGSETMSSCKARIAASIPKRSSGGSANISGVAAANGIYMPLASGMVTSDYGWRTGEFHTGIDFASGKVTNAYPVAAGRVVNIIYGSTSTCGNHIVYVYHNIGSGYTTSYWHLTNTKVSVGQNVTPSTPLGNIGDNSYTDPCAWGGHVHLNLFYGLSTTNAGRINPRILVTNIPSQRVWFSSPR